ncbi:MAG: thiamine pyrophosphate-binding protein [Actinomycetota bacterium]|nr:thiamine pyrophosphate-binding protein [Actinomycetota bacterium]
MQTAAQAIVGTLEAAGVRAVFGIPGVHNLPLFDALEESSIRTVVTRHEGSAAHAADGYARTTGGPGVVVTTTGPGAANAVAGIGEAWAASSPVLHLTTQVASDVLKAEAYRAVLHQSRAQIELFRPISGFTESVDRPERAAPAVERALAAVVSGRPRPAYVEVPHDLLGAPSGAAQQDGWRASSRPPSLPGMEAAAQPPEQGSFEDPGQPSEPGPPPDTNGPNPAGLEDAAAQLESARRVTVWAGGGVVHSGAAAELVRLAERLSAPVVTTFMGSGLIPGDHPLAVGLPPHEPPVAELLASSDVVVAAGTDFDGTMTQNGALRLPGKLIHIDLDPAQIGRAYPALGLVGDAYGALTALDDALARRGVDRAEARGHVAEHLAALKASVWDGLESDDRTREAAGFVRALRRAAPAETVIVADMCIAGYWCAGYLPVPAPRRLLYPMGWGTLGFGWPAALGAAAAGAERVVAVVGDGGFMYGLGELGTACEQALDIVILVVNDGGYGMLRFDEELRYGRTFAVDLATPDFGAIAGAFGVPYSLTTAEELEADVRAALEAGGPHLVELRARLFPPVTTSPRWPGRTAP